MDTLTVEEYERRALPRLARMDAIADRCGFEKFEILRTESERRYSAEWARLMREQTADEAAAGF